jgi:N-hydroxyarylamine O-acetyltransferase
MDVEQYLRRIAYDGPLRPSVAVLRALHRQHLFTVPFENLDIALRNPIVLDVALLYDKIVRRRRGGFCYELNGLFFTLLTALGFDVQMLSARVRRDDGGFGPDFDHMLLRVDLEEPWLVDVGFGDSFVDPIVFRAGGADQVNGHRYLVSPFGEQWQLLREDDQGETPLYVFRDEPRQLRDYEAMSRFHQTSPESGFTKKWICSRATAEGRITLANRRLIITAGDRREERVLRADHELGECLRDHFGMEFEDSIDWSRLSDFPSS